MTCWRFSALELAAELRLMAQRTTDGSDRLLTAAAAQLEQFHRGALEGQAVIEELQAENSF